jgi:hypothetical protein
MTFGSTSYVVPALHVTAFSFGLLFFGLMRIFNLAPVGFQIKN